MNYLFQSHHLTRRLQKRTKVGVFFVETHHCALALRMVLLLLLLPTFYSLSVLAKTNPLFMGYMVILLFILGS